MPKILSSTGFFRLLAVISLLILTFFPENAFSRQLDTALCLQADLVTGAFEKVESLPAGGDGFIVAIKSSYKESVLVNLTWEQVQGPDIGNKQLSKAMQVVAVNKTSFIPISGPEGGLFPGQFRLVFSIAGQPDEILNFLVKPSQEQSETVQENEESVSDALTKVFQTTEGPESAKAGIEVINKFFSQELDSTTSPKKAPAATPTVTTESEPEAYQTKNSPNTPQPTEFAPSTPTQKPSPVVAVGSSSQKQNEKTNSGGIQIICARRVADDKAPVDTPDFFYSNDNKIFLAMRSEDPAVKDLVSIEWFALEVEGLKKGVKITGSRDVLRLNSWNAVAFSPPSGGYFPGLYQVKVSKDETPLAQVDFIVKSRYETAPLLEEIESPEGMNVAHTIWEVLLFRQPPSIMIHLGPSKGS